MLWTSLRDNPGLPTRRACASKSRRVPDYLRYICALEIARPEDHSRGGTFHPYSVWQTLLHAPASLRGVRCCSDARHFAAPDGMMGRSRVSQVALRAGADDQGMSSARY